MSRYARSIFLAGFLAVAPAAATAAPSVGDDAPGAGPAMVQPVSVPVPAVRDEAAMVLIGTALIGLAAAVRRSA